MKIARWSVVIVVSHDGRGERISAMLRDAGVTDVTMFCDSAAALAHLTHQQANVLIACLDARPMGVIEWVRKLRRQRACRSHKAPVLVLASALTPSLIETCRNAGDNAVVGPPLERTLVRAIKRVLTRPRPFVEEGDYIGPCRRIAIVAVGALERRSER